MVNNEFEIDKYNLDEEWVRQPALYHKYAMMLADSRKEYETAKSRKDVVRAELDQEIRAAATKEGAKVTEAVVDSRITLSPLFQEAAKQVIDAKHHVDVAEAAVWAADHKKKGLESMVDLQINNYWSEPRVKGAGREQMSFEEKKRIRNVDD